MRVLLLLAFVAVAAATPLVGQNKCTQGPAYWCQHVRNAKECGAVRHCIYVWKNNRVPPPKSTESCLICKGLIKDIKTLVSSKTAQSEIQTLALKACALLHNEKTAQEVCDTVVTMFLPEIIQMIQQKLDEAVICRAVGLCSSQTLEKLIPVVKHVANKLKSQECDECKLGISLLKNYLTQNATQQEIISYLTNEICPRLPGELGTMCKTFVATNVPQLLKTLNAMLDAEKICSMLGMCPKKFNSKLLLREIIANMRPKNVKANPIECDLCEAGITDIRVELRQPNTQKAVVSFLKTDVCPHLGSLQVTCSQAVDQYIPVLFQLLVSELDPTSICTGLGLCSKSSVTSVKMLQISKPQPVIKHSLPKASVQCVVCEFVMSKIDQLIGTNRSEAAIQHALDEVCSILPTSIRSECTSFVDQYTPLVVKLLVQYVQPSVICKAVGLCAGETEPQNLDEKKMLATCDLMMHYLSVLIKGTKLKTERALAIVCNFVPRNDRHNCRKVQAIYKEKVMLLGDAGISGSKFTPKTFCEGGSHAQPKTMKPDGLVHLLGQTECTRGPSAWCASYKSATRCGAVQYCVQHVWKTNGHL